MQKKGGKSQRSDCRVNVLAAFSLSDQCSGGGPLPPPEKGL